jgi:predicted heme/steroid binding protein
MEKIRLEDLAAHDGKKGRPAWVAFEGKVYGLTESFLWQNGEHQVLHHAGRDLTEEMSQAPHGGELLKFSPLLEN